MNLVLRHKAAGLLVFTLSRGFRIFFFAAAGFLVIVLVSSYDPDNSNIGPVFLTLACLLCGSYYEAWIFNSKRRAIEHHHGFFLLFKRKQIAMQDLEAVQLSRFIKGQPGKMKKPVAEEGRSFFQPELHKLTLFTKEGTAYDVEILKSIHQKSLAQKAQAIADICQVPLVHEDSSLYKKP